MANRVYLFSNNPKLIAVTREKVLHALFCQKCNVLHGDAGRWLFKLEINRIIIINLFEYDYGVSGKNRLSFIMLFGTFINK